MKRFSFFALIFFIFSIMLTPSCKAQLFGGGDKKEKNKLVYWFNIKVQFKHDHVTGLPKYEIRVLSEKIYYGSIEKFERVVWKGLSSGARLSVGPYSNYDEAKQAVYFYGLDHQEEEPMKLDSTYNKGRTVSFYQLFIGKRPRSNSLVLERAPGAVTDATYQMFYELMKVSLKTAGAGGGDRDLAKLTIGPFWQREEAEESKRIYRLH